MKGSNKLLSIYLADHLAGSVAGIELVRRARSSNSANEIGSFLDELERDLQDDKRSLEEIIERFGTRRDRLKMAAGWLAEKVGRLKLNGSLVGYSDLSRVVELEGLRLGISGKLGLWMVLKDGFGDDSRLSGIDFDRLIERARDQLERVDKHRLAAARVAFDRPPQER
ncbi:MAG: hypothetical protein M3280_03520 [Actinomycetota bacterium]|nr:hypothetical protein [Actinomycetota bacterium]